MKRLLQSEINSKEEYLQVCGALLAVTRNMYVEALGTLGAARMFQEVANTFMIQEELINEFYYEENANDTLMPFRSEKQRKWMWANKPSMAVGRNGQRNTAVSLVKKKRGGYFMQMVMIPPLG